MARRRRSRFFDDTDDPRSGGSIEDQIAGGPPAGDEFDEGPSPLGVPREYEVAVQNQDRPGYYPHGFNYRTRGYGAGAHPEDRSAIIGPRYFDGDEWKPSQLSPAKVAQLQRAMATAGLLSDFRYGVWDSRSAKAYAEVLSFANASGMTEQMALQRMVNSPELSLGGGSGSRGGGRQIIGFDENGDPVYSEYVAPPLELKTTNRDDLMRAIRSGIIDRMGVGWSQQQVGELADLYIQKEIEAQRSVYDQKVALERTAFEQGEGAVSGRTIVEPSVPDPETFLENELKRRDLPGFQAGNLANDVMPMFEEAIRGWQL